MGFKSEVPKISPSVSVNLLVQLHRTPGNTYYQFIKLTSLGTSLLKDLIKDTVEQPGEETYRVRSGRGLVLLAFVLNNILARENT